MAKYQASMSSRARRRMIAAAEQFRTSGDDFGVEYEEETSLETEAEIARILGDFSARSD